MISEARKHSWVNIQTSYSLCQISVSPDIAFVSLYLFFTWLIPYLFLISSFRISRHCLSYWRWHHSNLCWSLGGTTRYVSCNTQCIASSLQYDSVLTTHFLIIETFIASGANLAGIASDRVGRCHRSWYVDFHVVLAFSLTVPRKTVFSHLNMSNSSSHTCLEQQWTIRSTSHGAWLTAESATLGFGREFTLGHYSSRTWQSLSIA